MCADGRFTRHPRFRYLPSTHRCAGGHYRQAGSMSASTHMMPSSFSLIVLTWLLFYHCSSITSTETHRVYIGMFAQARPPNTLSLAGQRAEPGVRAPHRACRACVPSVRCRMSGGAARPLASQGQRRSNQVQEQRTAGSRLVSYPDSHVHPPEKRVWSRISWLC